ncbi:MAG: Gfo/Idh/MocA family oxidoreductase [Planctomycetes bacterium]|nr:Gfo/Idh/MocA family oxidoreductase [Planctomycetota bacterium]
MGAGLLVLRDSRLALGSQANDRLNIAAIGVAGMGAGNVGNVSSENIVALCDVHESRAAKTYEKHPQAQRYTDFRRMLDEMDKQIDAVVVSTPDNTHAVAAISAMKRGKHVYCEKPLAKTVYEARLMRETARKNGVKTQMGNQGSASEGLRRAVELAWAGTVGPVREAHIWIGNGDGPKQRPEDQPPVPPDLNWDLWLGPAQFRPYHPSYCPAVWRGWRAFGSGGMGDMGCHTANLVFRSLRLDRLWVPESSQPQPERVVIRIDGKASEVDAEGFPRWTIVTFDMPARGDLPPVKVTVYSGGKVPPEDVMRGDPMTKWGAMVEGPKGAIFSDCPWNTRYALLPKSQFEGFEGPDKTLPRGPGHHGEWIEACKGRGETFSSFDIGGPLTEFIQLANASALVGEPFEYDTLNGQILNHPDANRHLHREYRDGWSL